MAPRPSSTMRRSHGWGHIALFEHAPLRAGAQQKLAGGGARNERNHRITSKQTSARQAVDASLRRHLPGRIIGDRSVFRPLWRLHHRLILAAPRRDHRQARSGKLHKS